MIYSLDKEVNKLMEQLESARRPDYTNRAESLSIEISKVIEKEMARQNEIAKEFLKEYIPSWVK